MTRLQGVLISACLGLLAWGALAAAANGKVTALNIEAQSVRTALQQFGAQTGLQVSMRLSGKAADDVKVSALSGNYTAEEGLRRLLSNTGLTFEFVNERMVAIRPMEKSTAAGMPADQMRLAAAGAQDKKQAAAQEQEGPQVVVQGEREKPRPFVDGNLDIGRTMDDAQPYYIFDSETIEASGAINVEDFLKQRLTMNTVVRSNSQYSSGVQSASYGNASQINLRGLGQDKTLILVNGRRLANIVRGDSTVDAQADLNGIPLSAIDRIEVLPSSASGIYGGSAIGGVVNVILKQSYRGGELRFSYDNVWDGDAPRRTASVNYGFGLEGGRTSVMLNASWSDAKPMLLRDRADILRANMERIQQNSPDYILFRDPWQGAEANLAANSASLPSLTLDGGIPFNSRISHIPAGLSPDASKAELTAALVANAGQWNLELPLSTRGPNGLLYPLGATPRTRSLRGEVRREMLPWLDAYVELSYNENISNGLFNPIPLMTVPASAPSNPFEEAVSLQITDSFASATRNSSVTRRLAAGFVARLPAEWTGLLDFGWSESRYDFSYYSTDNVAITAGLNADESAPNYINPFFDMALYPFDWSPYLGPNQYSGKSTLYSLALRGSGALPALPWGRPRLAVGLEHNDTRVPRNEFATEYNLSPTRNYTSISYARDQVSNSLYAELSAPLIRQGWLPGIEKLEMQLAGRYERLKSSAGTSGEIHLYFLNPPLVIYNGLTDNGEPFSDHTTYSSSNHTLGLLYQPVKELTLRVSLATAFLPPRPEQLTRSPNRVGSQTTITDPTILDVMGNPATYRVDTITGGNPDLVPASSKSTNAGFIWQPRWAVLQGLRFNLEYYRIEQFNYIASLGAQTLIDLESFYPDRVVRFDTGMIDVVDRSSMNLYRQESSGWDIGVSHQLRTDRGTFGFRASATRMDTDITQYTLDTPGYNSIGFPSEGGGLRYKGNASLSWQSRGLSAEWTATYCHSYKTAGAIGGPRATRGQSGSAIAAQGGDTIPSQMYHDLFLAYHFGEGAPGVGFVQGLLDGVTVQMNVRNVFNKVPPFDVQYDGLYLSPFGDVRLRSFALSVSKDF